MEDIAPELLSKIQNDFKAAVKNNDKLTKIFAKVQSGTATYNEANEYAIEAGEILAKSYKKHISSSVLPDGKMYYNIAERVITPTLTDNYNLVANITTEIQKSLNEAANIGIKAITPKLNQDRIDGIINRISSEDNFDDVAWILDEPVKTFSQSIVDDSIRDNAEFHAKAGLRPKIVRRLAGGCCEWCAKLAGSYTYPDVPKDVYRRHERCRCTVNYYPGDGKIQNVYSKKWLTKEEYDKIELRKGIGLKSLPLSLSEHPKRLTAYTPESLKRELEREGFEVKPLKQGSLKNIPFEEGGGYKVNFEDGGILQYHPATKSHHGGEYYKISTGKGGRHRYDTDGNEKND